MLKSILAIIVSYIAMFAIFMAIFTCLYFLLGLRRFSRQTVMRSRCLDRAHARYRLRRLDVSGYLCAAISKSWPHLSGFALIVFILALIHCFSALRRNNPDAPNTRRAKYDVDR